MANGIYDVIIVGAGISGLMAAYKLRKANDNIGIIIIEKGKPLSYRECPSAKNHIKCANCTVCDITNGFAGAGSFSDFKYNVGISYGGTLGDEIGNNVAMDYINKTNDILDSFLPDVNIPIFGTSEDLKLECLQNNLRLLDMKTRHFGTDNGYKIMLRLIDWLAEHNVEFMPNTEILDISIDDSLYELHAKGKSIYGNKIILATGRNGSEFVRRICNRFNIPVTSNAVDIGVRVEMKDIIWRKFSSKIYEPKILYRTKTFGDVTRLFCFNPKGIVSAENNSGIITVNGHAFANKDKQTDNCNFAVLTSIDLGESFNNPTEYAKFLSKTANIIGCGNVLVQRFGDLIRNKPTSIRALHENYVQPTLNATVGDISLVMPYRILSNIIETIYAIDKIAPGSASDDTLVYGLEAKYYAIKPKHNTNFMIAENIYLIGDASGISRGLSQSAAMGLYVADRILQNGKS